MFSSLLVSVKLKEFGVFTYGVLELSTVESCSDYMGNCNLPLFELEEIHRVWWFHFWRPSEIIY